MDFKTYARRARRAVFQGKGVGAFTSATVGRWSRAHFPAALGVVALGLVCSCGDGSSSTEGPAPASNGAVRAELPLGAPTVSGAVTYSVSGPAGVLRTGTISLDEGTSTSLTVTDIPAGSGYVLHFKGGGGMHGCSSSSPFAVESGGVTTTTMSATRCPPPGDESNWANWPVPPLNNYPQAVDPVTSLMWALSTVGTDVARADANNYCATISERGYGDWRLPSVIELISVTDFQITGGVFHVTPGANPVYSATRAGADDHWSASWLDGRPSPSTPDYGPVLCVRSDAPADGTHDGRYVVDASGATAEDVHTQLVWQRTTAPAALSIDDARAYCASQAVSDALGGTGWRLPNVKELWTLVDFSATAAPTIDGTAFPGTPPSYFWTDTDYADGPPSGPITAWAVDFSSGQGATLAFADPHYVRCVR